MPQAYPPRNPLEDPSLDPYRRFLLERGRRFADEIMRIREKYGSLSSYADLHLNLGPHRITLPDGTSGWRWREYMPNARSLWLTMERLRFQRHARFRFTRLEDGFFELLLNENDLAHDMYVELRVDPFISEDPSSDNSACLKRVPAFSRRVEQNAKLPGQWCARLWLPREQYRFQNARPPKAAFQRIYEAHVGMAQDAALHTKDTIGSYRYFSNHVLPRIRAAGYTDVQLMGIPEHPLYRSFGYQVSSYFAPCSRFGTPDDLKALVDAAHGLGLRVLLDIPHAHCCANTEQGLARYDGSNYLCDGAQNQWGTPSFDFSQEMTRRLLLSNLRYWLEEYRVDGFRFDAVGNILYLDHGTDDDFSHVGRCFYGKDGGPRQNLQGELYLSLANALVHELLPSACTIAEEFSGMPGITCPPAEGGLGFDARFAMGIPDYWTKYLKKPLDMGSMWYEMTNHRPYDRTVSYVECHDQCINGDDAMIWRILGDDMYRWMAKGTDTWKVSRGLAFYRLMRLITFATADVGYLNFMGNEFGHPEWLDDAEHAHRQWRLADDENLKYAALARWDKAQMKLAARCEREFTQAPLFRFIHEEDRLLVFERGAMLFAFNFHETLAQSPLHAPVSPGKYIETLSSDETCYAGHGNLKAAQGVEHFTKPTRDSGVGTISLYLPPMTALVLLRDGA
ncbi:MAG: alpha amylase C-terminal domain-containing protein [Desulfovibrio sp.]|nr:alpha amylase C-terminal domain-containing protein [Desulfovibrio sp.]